MKNVSDGLLVILRWFLFLSGVILFSACTRNHTKDVERVAMPLMVFSSDLMSSMPGTLLVYEKELVWIDAGGDQSIHVIDRESGAEKKVLEVRGNGPEEIVTPEIAWAPDRQLLVYDKNGAR